MYGLIPIGTTDQLAVEDLVARRLAASKASDPTIFLPDAATVAAVLSDLFPARSRQAATLQPLVYGAYIALEAHAQHVAAHRQKRSTVDRILQQARLLDREGYAPPELLKEAALATWSDSALIALDTLQAETAALRQSFLLSAGDVRQRYPDASVDFLDAVEDALLRRRLMTARRLYHSTGMAAAYDRRAIFECVVTRWNADVGTTLDVQSTADLLAASCSSHLRSRLRRRARLNGIHPGEQRRKEVCAAVHRQRHRLGETQARIAALVDEVHDYLNRTCRHSAA
jgi:hypothetical protein